jgi:hypothetical protein
MIRWVERKVHLNINHKSLLRPPVREGQYFEDRLAEIPAPDGRFAVVTSHDWEPENGWWLCLFTLMDTKGSIVNRFEPLAGVPGKCLWSLDSRYFMIAAFANGYFYFIYDVTTERFALIRIANPYPLAATFQSGHIVVAVEEEELKNANVGWDEEVQEVPLERYSASSPLAFRIQNLEFHSRSEQTKVPRMLASLREHNLEIYRDGLWPFHGQGPKATNQEFYGRQMEIFHLELFAEYGDETAKRWLAEVQRRSKGKYSKWDQVTKYLGELKAG